MPLSPEAFALRADLDRVADLLEHLYCPRFTWYEQVLRIPENQERRYKVQRGRTVHHERLLPHREHLRKRLGVIGRRAEVEIASEPLGLRGRVDEVLLLDDGTAAPLDIKFALWTGCTFDNQVVQNVLYGMLIEEQICRPVRRGFLVYVRSHNHLETVTHDDQARARALAAVDDYRRVIRGERIPTGTPFEARCRDCTYLNICEDGQARVDPETDPGTIEGSQEGDFGDETAKTA